MPSVFDDLIPPSELAPGSEGRLRRVGPVPSAVEQEIINLQSRDAGAFTDLVPPSKFADLLPTASEDDRLQAAMVTNATHATFDAQERAAAEEEQRLAEEDAIWRDAWNNQIRTPGLGERLRSHPIVQRLIGPPPAEQELRAELGLPRGGSPGQIAMGALQITAAPPPIAEAARRVTEPAISMLPDTAAGIARGVRETFLGWPLAAPPSKTALAAFATQWAWEQPEQRKAFQRAIDERDHAAAAQIATQNFLMGGLFAHGTATPLHEFTLRLQDNLRTSVPGITPGAADTIARSLLEPRNAQRVLKVEPETLNQPDTTKESLDRPAGLTPEQIASREATQAMAELRALKEQQRSGPATQELTTAKQTSSTPAPGSAAEGAIETAASRPFLRPREDGIPDLLDDIQHLGGIKPPGSQAGAGEYDGYLEAFSQGPARLLMGGSNRPDLLLQGLRELGHKFETPDEMYEAVKAASAERDALKARLKAENTVRDESARRVQDAYAAALEGKHPSWDEVAELEGSLNQRELKQFNAQLVKLRTLAQEAPVDPDLVPFDPVERIRELGRQTGAGEVDELLARHGSTRTFSDPAQAPVAPEGEGTADPGEGQRPGQLQRGGPESADETGTVEARAISKEDSARIARVLIERLEALEREARPLRATVRNFGPTSKTHNVALGHLRYLEGKMDALRAFYQNLKDTPATRAGEVFGEPMNAPVPAPAAATPAPGTPGTAVFFDARLPVTLARTAKGSVSVPQVMSALENVITAAGGQTPIRVGRFNKQRARGVYNPRTEVARVNSADNIPTATHEIGHASQKLLYGSAYAQGLRGLPAAVKRELVALGRALYGNTRPAAGYTGEGWAEFIRLFVTTDDAARQAPALEKFFREKVMVDHPKFGRAVMAARQLVDVYRAQGSAERIRRQQVKAPGSAARLAQTIRDTVGTAAQVDEFEPLRQLSRGYAERSGNTLAPYEDPFLLASWKRGTAGAVVETMVNDAMIDPWGNPLYGPGNMSLRQALAPIKGRGAEFADYLLARRAIERWRKNKNPGITLEDAVQRKAELDSPEFQLAAQNYYEWNRGLLEYVRAADPAMSDTIDAILNSSYDYAPLARVIDPKGATAAAAAARSNPLARMHGSGRQIRDIMETTIENAARLVSHAHRKMVLEAIVKLSHKEGMGFLVEEVPRDKVKVDVNFEKLRQQLEDAGVDTSNINQDAILSYFDLADKPKGADPIVVVKEADGLRWYHVSPGVYDVLNGLKTPSLAEIPHIGKALDLLLGVPARAFRLGTTGLRASFSLFTNPTRDLRTFLLQTQSHANPAELGAAYFSALGEVVRNGFTGKASPHVEAFYRLGAQLGQPLGIDIRHTRRAARELFRAKIARVVTNPLDHLRDLFQITESAPRVAELKLMAKEVGWTPGQTMTPDQAVQLALAAKRVTVDFSAAGRISRLVNQAVPFFNATIQGSRSFLRALRDNPARAVLVGLATFTVPALLNWWRNKDQEWYRQLPWRERYLYDNIHDGQNVWQIPRPPEWGNLFAVLPEAILDSWYQKDPRGAVEALKHIFATTNPLDYPVPLKIAKEQWQNRIDFFDRPIVPRSQVDLPPGEQRGPYTTKLGEWLGNAFPNTVSPRRFDAGVRSYFGGAVPDLLDAVGLGAVKRDREWERSDLPILGRMFRRGGEISAQNLALGDYYDDLARYSARHDAMQRAEKEGREPLNPLDGREYAYWKLLQEMQPNFKAASQAADQTNDLKARQSLYRDMAREAEGLLKLRPKH